LVVESLGDFCHPGSSRPVARVGLPGMAWGRPRSRACRTGRNCHLDRGVDCHGQHLMGILVMISRTRLMMVCASVMGVGLVAGAAIAAPDAVPPSATDPVATLVSRLDLAQYKATIKGLTKFGDRRQGTQRNRDAIDWIEAQLKSYGCTPTARITYDFQPRERPARTPEEIREARLRFMQARKGPGGSHMRGNVVATGVNTDPMKQPDAKLRALDTPPSVPGERQEVYCTKVGTTHPEEMYIVSGHMDGIGWGEAANDDGSGTALVMQLARVFSSPDVKTDRSIRFILWNNEETGLNGAKAYVEQREALQGKENPAGSGKYPEPRWLGVIQHDMMMFDHGMPRADGTMSPVQRPEADVNIEFQSNSKMADASQKLAWILSTANDKYATDYPAKVGQHMTNTDSQPFENLVPSISLR